MNKRTSSNPLGDDEVYTELSLKPTVQTIEQEYYDETEQLEMISKFHEGACFQYKVYSILLSTATGFCSLLFFYFAYTSEDFGESIDRVQLLHVLSGLGLFCLTVRCLQRYGMWRQSRNMMNRVSDTISLLDRHEDATKDDLGIIPPALSVQTFSGNKWNNQVVLSVCLYVALMCSVLSLLLWSSKLMEQMQYLINDLTMVKAGIVVFPFVLPLMTLAEEYGHSLLNQNFVEILDLDQHRYKFKDL